MWRVRRPAGGPVTGTGSLRGSSFRLPCKRTTASSRLASVLLTAPAPPAAAQPLANREPRVLQPSFSLFLCMFLHARSFAGALSLSSGLHSSPARLAPLRRFLSWSSASPPPPASPDLLFVFISASVFWLLLFLTSTSSSLAVSLSITRKRQPTASPRNVSPAVLTLRSSRCCVPFFLLFSIAFSLASYRRHRHSPPLSILPDPPIRGSRLRSSITTPSFPPSPPGRGTRSTQTGGGEVAHRSSVESVGQAAWCSLFSFFPAVRPSPPPPGSFSDRAAIAAAGRGYLSHASRPGWHHAATGRPIHMYDCVLRSCRGSTVSTCTCVQTHVHSYTGI